MPCHWGALFRLVNNYNTTLSKEHLQSNSVRRYEKNDKKTKVTLQRRCLLDDDDNVGSVDLDGASYREKSGDFSGSHAGSVHSKMSQGSFVYNDSVSRLLSQDKKQKRRKLQDLFNSPSSEKENYSDEKSLIYDPLWLKRVQKDPYDSSQYLSSHSGFSARAAPRSAHSYIQSRSSKNPSFGCSKTSVKDGQKSKKGHIYKRNVSMCGYVPKAVRNLETSSALNGEKIDDFFLKCRLEDEQTKFANTEQVRQRIVSLAPQVDILSEDLEKNDEFENDVHDKVQIMDGTISEIHTVSINTHKVSAVHDMHNVVLHEFDHLSSPNRNVTEKQHDNSIDVDSREGYVCLFDPIGTIRSVNISDTSGFTNETREIYNQPCEVKILTEKGSTDEVKLMLEHDAPCISQSMDGTFNHALTVLAQPGINPNELEITPDEVITTIGDTVLYNEPMGTSNEKMSVQASTNFASDDHYIVDPSSSIKTENSSVHKWSRDMPWKGSADVLY
ncbi:hypothetical protein ACJMK2_010119 [Sinanodonta woodiana]|uniref:Uncharacterized protein n=1 Tax=Sinanodonta woodiana TaxID=1069815 RepID=A0ABD3VEB8_SINWO